MTIEGRALPDYRDGLKPVQRRVLWSAHTQGIHNKGAFKKAARIVGSCISQYHPHGDQACFSALVNITNTSETQNVSVGLIEGQGNFGWYNAPSSAYRYVECKLSTYSDQVLFSSDYLAVTDMLFNFDGTEKEPLVLPSLLPTLLLNGTFGIAVGVKTGIPPFKLPGVITLVKKALAGETVTVKDCLQNLEFNFPYKPIFKSDKQALLTYYKTGKANLSFCCDYVVVPNSRTVRIVGLPPSFSEERLVEKVSLEEVVANCRPCSSEKEGIDIRIELKSTVPMSKVEETFKSLLAKKTLSGCFYSTVQCQTNVTIRKVSNIGTELEQVYAEFKEMTVPSLINDWCVWRIELESKMLAHVRSKMEERIKYLELLTYACSKLTIIFEVLKSKVSDLDKVLAKRLDISVDDAKTILALQVRRLSRLSNDQIQSEIDGINSDLKVIKRDQKQPAVRIVKAIDAIKIAKFNMVT